MRVKGIITTTAREKEFPIPLSTTAEQVYLSALLKGFGKDDDAGIVRMYYPGPVSKASATLKEPLTSEVVAGRTELVLKLLRGIHVCAAAEAIAFTKHLGLDLEQFYELTKDAAGGSREFQGPGWEMIKLLQGQSNEEDGVAALIRERLGGLKEVVAEARRLECPLYLGTMAMNLCLMAVRKDKEARVSVLPRVWE
jgi:3-hydroxyisobutyrate dehydrogenase